MESMTASRRIDWGAALMPLLGCIIVAILLALVAGFTASFTLGWFTATTGLVVAKVALWATLGCAGLCLFESVRVVFEFVAATPFVIVTMMAELDEADESCD